MHLSCCVERARRHTAITSTSNGEYDVNDELSLKERLRRAESVRTLSELIEFHMREKKKSS